MGAANTAFCTGASAMSHYGFYWPDEKDVFREYSCIVFLFNSVMGEYVVPVALDNEVKYAFATLGTAAMGVAAQGMVKARRTAVKKYAKTSPKTSLALEFVGYVVQVGLAYLLMMLSMTYSSGLFAGIIVGLTVGHVAFNYDPNDDRVERCC